MSDAEQPKQPGELWITTESGEPIRLDVSDAKIEIAPDLPGLHPVGPIIISGTWWPSCRCPLCRKDFTIDDNVPWPHVEIGDPFGPISVPVCQACAMEQLARGAGDTGSW